ncbi:AmiS/UreI family transporter [Nakamurella lactea]|uniref:AmiS/UreI family transporter n=1 Tax=Nakamurella lactea TaxID=459515 RepID=UPI00040D6DFC|nr:AmiS/UreI family transporter [Nakamurella lactea]
MGNVGLLLVGAVLLVNGLVILNVVPPRSAAMLNIFVGTAQVVLPTIILIQGGTDPAVLNATWPSYLFGMTYLYYGLGIYLNLEPEGFGWFSSFVAVIVLYQAISSVGSDPVFAVMWLTWAIMWSLFFALMALGRSELSRFTGWFLVLLGVPSCTVTALLLLEGRWSTEPWAGLVAAAVLVLGGVLSWTLARSAALRSGDADDAAAAAPAVDATVATDGTATRRAPEPLQA